MMPDEIFTDSKLELHVHRIHAAPLPAEFEHSDYFGFLRKFTLPITIPEVVEAIGIKFGGGRYKISIIKNDECIADKEFDIAGMSKSIQRDPTQMVGHLYEKRPAYRKFLETFDSPFLPNVIKETSKTYGTGSYILNIVENGKFICSEKFEIEETMSAMSATKGIQWKGTCSGCDAVTTVTSPRCYPPHHEETIFVNCANCSDPSSHQPKVELKVVFAITTFDAPSNSNESEQLKKCSCPVETLMETGCNCGGK